ncbi:MAG: FKBP-type peptidyl-prolyl cis-trans isomerase [Pseudomonadales bacterium]|nr:FKBP-type peptidyl-prolyl cis-trans isomerase [Pseudomonadales bacterium]
MSFKYLITNAIVAVTLVVSNMSFAADEVSQNDDHLAYYYGYSIGNMLRAEGFESIDDAMFNAGIKDALSAKKPRLSQQELEAVVNAVREQRKILKAQQLASLEQEGMAFLTSNATRDGVKTTASGLQYKQLVAGTGKQPSATSTVLAHYKGELINGQEFDSSYKSGAPVEFNLSAVIPGWTEGLQLMKQGGQMRFFIPAELGYGPGGTRNIPPNSVLVFDVELVEVKD